MTQRILILTTENPEHLGGTEHFIRMLQECLRSKCYDVAIIDRSNCGMPWRRSQSKYPAYLQDAFLGYFVGRKARSLLKKNAGNIAGIISNSNVGWYPLRTKVRQWHMYHGTYREQGEAIRPLISTLGYLKQKWWDSMVLERMSGRGKLILVNSDQTAHEVRNYFGYASQTIWLPLDTSHFRPLDQQECRKILKIPEGRPVGLFVGNTHPAKGFPIIRKLLERLPNIYWVIAVRGELPVELAERENVRLLQNVNYNDIPVVYGSADFSISASLYESFGYVVAESLACGTPVIASPGGASCLFMQKTPLDAMLVQDMRDFDGFTAAIERLLSNPSFYREAVLRDVRPRIETLMSSENWYKRFAEVTGL